MGRDLLDEYNASLITLLHAVLETDNRFLSELGIGDAQVFDEYFTFFFENGFKEQADFIKCLIIYIRDDGTKSFEETYLLKESAHVLLEQLNGEVGDVD